MKDHSNSLHEFLVFLAATAAAASKDILTGQQNRDQIDTFCIVLCDISMNEETYPMEGHTYHSPQDYLDKMKSIVQKQEKINDKEYKYLCDLVLALFRFQCFIVDVMLENT